MDDFQNSAWEMGISATTDFNSGTNEGVGYFEVNQKGGRRWSTARAFLNPAVKRPNLRLLTQTHVQRITFVDGRATGVEITRKGQCFHASAKREILLAAWGNPFASPSKGFRHRSGRTTERC